MLKILKLVSALLAVAFLLPACSNAADVAAGKAYFEANCALCHDVSPAMTTFQGPGLFGVVGRKVGSAKGFDYSDALKTANGQGTTWTAATLDTFLADPQKAMPGTAMPVSVNDAQDRKHVIAYLAGLNAAPAKDDAKPSSVAATTGPAKFDWHKDAPGVVHTVTLADMPAPFATQSAGNNSTFVAPPEGFLPKVPAGFTVSLFASVENPRLLHMAPDGDLYVAQQGRGTILIYRNHGGVLDTTPETFADGLNQPYGLSFYPAAAPQYVYVAEVGAVVRIPIGGGKAETVVAHLASTGGHSTRDLAFSPDGKYMYVSVGSGSNVAEGMSATPPGGVAAWEATHGFGSSWGDEDGRALVLRFAPDGSDRHVVATGIRNCVGLNFRPGTNDLYCSTNERDALGDNLVPDYFTRVSDGQFFGWPWYYLGDHNDPRHKGERSDVISKINMPDMLFVSHSAPLGFVFYQAPSGAAHAFPADYAGDAFIALHGSWNRAQRTGTKGVRVHIKDGKPDGNYEDFMTGFVIDDQHVSGRPAAVAVGPDGALYVGDDTGGKIWRIAPN